MNHNFQLVNVDTDSISFTDNGRPFSKEERKSLLDEINAIMPEYIKFEDDGYFQRVLVLKIKNYVLKTEDGKIKTKGSTLRDNKQPAAIKEFKMAIVEALLNDQSPDHLREIYNKSILELWNIQTSEQIKRWSKKYTISDKTLESDRTNETKVVDAIEGTEYVEGDRIWLFFRNDKSLCLVENFNNDYDKNHLLKSLYNATEIFENVIPEGTFINYSLAGSKESLYNLLNIPYEKPVRKKK